MPGLPSTFISPDEIRSAMEEAENRLQPPDGAEISGVRGTPGYRASWSEVLDITRVETAPSKKGTGWIVTQLEATCAPDVPGANPGRSVRWNISLLPGVTKGQQGFQLHCRGLARMANLLTAAQLIAEGEGFSPAQYFDNPDTELLGRRVVATYTEFTKRDRTEDKDVGSFTPWATAIV